MNKLLIKVSLISLCAFSSFAGEEETTGGAFAPKQNSAMPTGFGDGFAGMVAAMKDDIKRNGAAPKKEYDHPSVELPSQGALGASATKVSVAEKPSAASVKPPQEEKKAILPSAMKKPDAPAPKKKKGVTWGKETHVATYWLQDPRMDHKEDFVEEIEAERYQQEKVEKRRGHHWCSSFAVHHYGSTGIPDEHNARRSYDFTKTRDKDFLEAQRVEARTYKTAGNISDVVGLKTTRDTVKHTLQNSRVLYKTQRWMLRDIAEEIRYGEEKLRKLLVETEQAEAEGSYKARSLRKEAEDLRAELVEHRHERHILQEAFEILFTPEYKYSKQYPSSIELTKHFREDLCLNLTNGRGYALLCALDNAGAYTGSSEIEIRDFETLITIFYNEYKRAKNSLFLMILDDVHSYVPDPFEDR